MRTIILLILIWLFGEARAATITAASASLANVQTAVNAASNGDTVLIPNGSATWNAPLNIAGKRIIIRALNYTPTARPTTGTARNVTITYTGTTGFAMEFASGSDFHCGVGGIKFLPPSSAGQSNQATGIWGFVHFTGSGSKPALMFDCHLVANERQSVTSSEASFLSIDSQGGVIWNTLFDGSQVPPGSAGGGGDGASGAGIHITSPRAWASQSTMGTLDTGGTVNVYFEDCHLYIWGQADVDNNGRLVVRYSTMNGTSWQTHGFTSTFGGRHAELYNNDFINTVNNRNFQRYFWLRAATVLFADNPTVSNQNTGYGTPFLLQIGDDSRNPTGPYPLPRGPGRGYWTSDVSDPIYLWNNTGAGASANVTGNWADHCVLNRDYFVNSGAKPGVPGSGGTAYAKYIYPHPLRAAISGDLPPSLGTPSINTTGLTLSLPFSEPVQAGTGGSGGWTLNASGGAVTVNSGSMTGSGSTTLSYTLSRAIQGGETVTVSYTQPGNGIEDLANNDLASLSNQPVTNGSTAGQVVATPVITLPAGPYFGTQTTTITEADTGTGAVIHYTTDGSTPTGASPVYSAPLSIQTNQTIKAIAIWTGHLNSAVASSAYEVVSWVSPGTAWKTFQVPQQTGKFTWNLSITAPAAGSDVTVGIGPSAVSDYTGMACLIEFAGNTINARNGGAYTTGPAYTPDSVYNFVATINVNAHTWSLTSTPAAGGPTTAVVTNAAFRTEQAAAAQLSYIGMQANSGTTTISAMSFSSVNAPSRLRIWHHGHP